MAEVLKRSASWSRHNVWKYCGAAFMEEKNGVQAVSLHKALGLIMFFWCLWQWTYPTASAEGYAALDSDAVYTLWGLLGLKAVSQVKDALRPSSASRGDA